MEYRFSLTPRLAALGVFASAALVVLLFALGFVLGQRKDEPAEPAAAPALPAEAAVAPAVAADPAVASAAPAAPSTESP
jgi:hypothetical protein